MHKITTAQYSQAWRDFQAGKITEQQWVEIARKMWEQNMEENIDVFKRMKNR